MLNIIDSSEGIELPSDSVNGSNTLLSKQHIVLEKPLELIPKNYYSAASEKDFRFEIGEANSKTDDVKCHILKLSFEDRCTLEVCDTTGTIKLKAVLMIHDGTPTVMMDTNGGASVLNVHSTSDGYLLTMKNKSILEK